ncbi:MAG: HEPN domain-containing protein [Patescibacteria group bacterium]
MRAIEFFILNIQRSEELLKLHEEKFPIGRPASKGVTADLLRAVIVFTVAALDAYIHKRTIEIITKIIHHKKRVPERCVERIRGKFKDKDGYKELTNLIIQKDPTKRLINFLEESLGSVTFQKPESIQMAFSMMEINDGWKQVNKFLSIKPGRKKKGRRADVRGIVATMAERRDSIVHRNDVYYGNKHHGKVRPITRKEVRDNLETFRAVVYAIEHISEKI